jgi:hypothetical protein
VCLQLPTHQQRGASSSKTATVSVRYNAVVVFAKSGRLADIIVSSPLAKLFWNLFLVFGTNEDVQIVAKTESAESHCLVGKWQLR